MTFGKSVQARLKSYEFEHEKKRFFDVESGCEVCVKQKRRLNVKRAVFAVMMVLSLVLCSCRNEQDVVKIGAVLPLTGSGANYGISLKQGIDLAVEEVNASGGIKGVKLIVVYEDSRSDAKVGVSAFNKLVATDKVPLVFGSLSSIILAIQPEADKKNVVLINSSAISPLIYEKADNFLFSIMVNGATEAIFMANEFQKRNQNEKIAVLFSNNSSGIDTKNKFVAELNSLGNSNVYTEAYELDSTDFKIQLESIKKTDAKYGYLIAFSSKEFADILKQTKELGLNIQWYSYSGIETKETIELAREAANGVIYSYPQYNVSDALYSSFQEKYNARYNSWADIYTVTSYDGVHLVANVMEEFGTTAIDVQRGLRAINKFDGIFGNIDLSSDDKQCVQRELMWKKIENLQYKVMD